MERALLQRQQQSEAFTLQLRQSQQRLQVSPGDLNQQQYLDAQHMDERQRFDNLGEQQQLSIGQGVDRQTIERQRRAEMQNPFELRLPPPQVRAPVTPRPRDPEPYFPRYN